MRSTLIVIACVAATTVAFAQAQNPPAKSEPGNAAINAPGNNPGSGPVTGATSFTEGQAKSQIESKGFSNVSDLKKDDNGIWRGKAQKDGKSVNVAVDFKGDVASQ